MTPAAFLCPEHGEVLVEGRGDIQPCPKCKAPAKRLWVFRASCEAATGGRTFR